MNIDVVVSIYFQNDLIEPFFEKLENSMVENDYKPSHNK